MSSPNAILDERQITILTRLTAKVLHDPAYLTETLKDLPGTLIELGADENDVKAIGSYMSQLTNTVKEKNNVGFW